MRNKYIKKGKMANFLLCFLFLNLLFVFNVSANTGFDIVGNHGISIDAKTGEVLYEKNAYKYDKVYPASVTKVLTAIMLVENVKEQEEITLSK